MLKRGWPSGSFRRTVKDDNGQSRVLEFTAGEPTEVDDIYAGQLSGDIGNALTPLSPPVTVDVPGDDSDYGRCQFVHKNGKQCKQEAGESGYCEKHQQGEDEDG